MNPLVPIIAAMPAEAAAVAEEALDPLTAIVLAVVLVIAGLLALVAEIFVISGGLLALLAAVLGVSGIVVAFQAHPLAGWILLIGTPLAAIAVTLYGLHRLRNSRLVAQEVVAGDAGIHHAAERSGIAIGSEGVLKTRALPGGRAVFGDTSLDVIARGGSLDAGTAVKVVAIEDASIYVVASGKKAATLSAKERLRGSTQAAASFGSTPYFEDSPNKE